jgi:hypothetical protein
MLSPVPQRIPRPRRRQPGTAREIAIDCFDNPDGNRYHDLLIGSIPDQVYSAASMLGSAMAPVKF